MAAHVGLVKDGVFFGKRFPRRCAGGRLHQQQLFVCGFNTEVTNIRSRESTSAYETVAWRPGPSRFHKQSPHAVSKRDEMSNHRRRRTAETMPFLFRNLNTRAGAICFTRTRLERGTRPEKQAQCSNLASNSRARKGLVGCDADDTS